MTRDEQLALSSGIQAYLLVHAVIVSLKEARVISDRQALRIMEAAQRKAGMLQQFAPTTALTMAVASLNQQVGAARRKLQSLH